jgi:hypothetical protein
MVMDSRNKTHVGVEEIEKNVGVVTVSIGNLAEGSPEKFPMQTSALDVYMSRVKGQKKMRYFIVFGFN